MINDIIVLDDVVSKQYQNLIVNSIINDKNFPWYFVPTITRNQNFEDSIDDSYGFSHRFITSNSGNNSYVAHLLSPLLYEACDKINFNLTAILEGRCFMTFPIPGRELEINNYHNDIPGIDHLVCLYYVNDSTGDTIISSLKEGDVLDIKTIDKKEIPILKRIQPKKGRCVFFNGKHYHASSVPQTNKRCIINFDFI